MKNKQNRRQRIQLKFLKERECEQGIIKDYQKVIIKDFLLLLIDTNPSSVSTTDIKQSKK